MRKFPVVFIELVVIVHLVMGINRVEAKSRVDLEPIKGPVAVVALVSDGDFENATRLADEVNKALIAESKVQVMKVEWLANRLGENRSVGIGRVDFERLEGLFQQGYLQSFSFEYDKALLNFRQVLEGLEKLPSTEEHWKLWIKTNVFLGIVHMGRNDPKKTIEHFTQVLRTRKSEQLKKQEYSPKVIKLWKNAQRRLKNLSKGRLSIESKPSGVKVLLDGMLWGMTPFKGRFPHGSYRLELVQSDTSYMERKIYIGPKPLDLRYQMSFEGALVLDRGHPCLRIPNDRTNLPEHWWPWLGVRLNMRYLVTVQHRYDRSRSRLSAALIDLERGRQIREGWLEISDVDPIKLRKNASDLARFLITGKAVERIEVGTDLNTNRNGKKSTQNEQSAEADQFAHKRPWYRSWWPYTIAAGATLALAIGGHVAANNYQNQADDTIILQERNALLSKSNAWTVVAVSGYVLASASVITGLIFTLSYEPTDTRQAGVDINLGLNPLGLVLWGTF